MPFAISIVPVFIPSRSENESSHMRWRYVFVIIGSLFSILAWIQQSRAVKKGAADRQEAIKSTSVDVAANLGEKFFTFFRSSEFRNVLDDELAKAGMDKRIDIKAVGAVVDAAAQRYAARVVNQQVGQPIADPARPAPTSASADDQYSKMSTPDLRMRLESLASLAKYQFLHFSFIDGKIQNEFVMASDFEGRYFTPERQAVVAKRVEEERQEWRDKNGKECYDLRPEVVDHHSHIAAG